MIHGSLNPDNAQKEIDWFQTLSDSSLSSKSSSSSSSIPVMVNTATATNKKNLLKKPATMAKSTTKGGTVSGTSPHQRKRDTTSADEPRLRKPLTTNNTVVRSKIPPPSNTVVNI